MTENELPVKRIDGGPAERLADLASVYQDLQFVVECCKRLGPLLREENSDHVIVQALWSAALVAYARSFAGGRRLGLTEEDVEHLPGEPIAAHRYYRHMRDKHIAHSVNPFEEVLVGVVLSHEASPDRKVEGVATIARRLLSDTSEGLSNLEWLARTLKKRVAQMAKAQEEEVLEWAKRQPLELLDSLGLLRSYVPGPEAVTKPRNRQDT